MNILLVSECDKRALIETRKVLDQFAERKGRRTWQTPITQQGLATLRVLLKKTARKNTAVSCFRIYGKNHQELLWIVGNRRRFNHDGTVPTNRTSKNILKQSDENALNCVNVVAVLAGIAGLFHDFGKANALFQKKLKPKAKSRHQCKSYEPYRHEWLSLELFLAFVGERKDVEWLAHLADISPSDEMRLQKLWHPKQTIAFDDIHATSPLAACVAWLILSHHRLPYDHSQTNAQYDVNGWCQFGVGVEWNSCNHHDFDEAEKLACRTVPHGLPVRSASWCHKARQIAKRGLRLHNLKEFARLDFAFPMHYARLALMLADHTYSASEPTVAWQDNQYRAIANTDRKTGDAKQKLDEHCVGVAHHAYILSRALQSLRPAMPVITRHSTLKKRTPHAKFRWQNQAYDVACSVRESSQQQGFFGVNMASTGKGKTFANARILYGLSDPQLGCRFNVALGLRSLTLQTGDAFREKLHLEKDDLAIVVGSQAVADLYAQQSQLTKTRTEHDYQQVHGSESEWMFAEHAYVRYDGELENSYLDKWLHSDNNRRRFAHQLVSAPIAVSTIDHLITATEGIKGGQQIAAMLRLMTSDLVLDEPDDYGNADLPAISRLVYWAGMLGSRVLLSSATLPPELVVRLFQAYRIGRQEYNRVIGDQMERPVVCAWFDEHRAHTWQYDDVKAFKHAHHDFVLHRVKDLAKRAQPLHQATVLPIDAPISCHDSEGTVATHFADHIHEALQTLAKQHHTTIGEKHFSAGIVRMANIEPLVAVARRLMTLTPAVNTRIHYVVYHSQHPLAVRSEIEAQLDKVLMRGSEDSVAHLPEVQAALKTYPEKYHILVVLATPVAEVGRDHDYDWAVIEPSSIRSMIQLAGRVQRHRRNVPKQANIMMTSHNIRALKDDAIAFHRPGYESSREYRKSQRSPLKPWLKLPSHDVRELVELKHLACITAEPRIIEPQGLTKKDPIDKLDELEHLSMMFVLRDQASPFWRNPKSHLFGEIQRLTRFRKSEPRVSYVLAQPDSDPNHENDQLPPCPEMLQWDRAGGEWINSERIEPSPELQVSARNQAWIATSLPSIIRSLSDTFDIEEYEAYQRFATIDLPELAAGARWLYHPILGVYQGKE